MKNINSKAQSAIISTVLLILLVVVAAMIIFSFVIPFITDKLSEGNCIDVVGKVQIDNDPRYTCYDNTNKNVSVKIRIGAVRELIEGFRIEVDSISSQTVDITEGVATTGVWAYNGSDYVTNLMLPGNNGAITYLINHASKPDSVNVYPILKDGPTCDSTYGPVLINNCI